MSSLQDCNLFFYEFHVILWANVFHHVCYTANKYSLQRLWTRGLTLIDVFLTLAGGKGQRAMLFSDARVFCLSRGCSAASHCQFQQLLIRTPAFIFIISKLLCMACRASISLWCSLCHVYGLNSVQSYQSWLNGNLAACVHNDRSVFSHVWGSELRRSFWHG